MPATPGSGSARPGCGATPTATPRALEAPVYIDRRLDAFDGGSIYLVEDGEGPPIVFAHGVTNSIRTWFHQLEEFPRAGFRAIAYDHRGHGQSVLGPSGHSLENLALDLRTVIEELDLRGAVLVGHSMGGVAVQAFVTQFPRSRPSASRASCCSPRSPRRRSARTRPAPRRASRRSPTARPT